MNVWLWLLIGFLTGLVLAAIVSLLFRGGSAKEENKLQSDTAAKLAKAEVKITMLEDKLRLANADHLALQAKLEADNKEKLAAAQTEYRAALAALESENSTLTAALATAHAEQKALQEQIDLQEKTIEFDTGTITPEMEDKGTGIEDQIVFTEIDEEVDDNLVPDSSEDSELLESNIAPEALAAAALIGFDEREAELEIEEGLLVEGTESILELEMNEGFVGDLAPANEEIGIVASANGEQSAENGEELEAATADAADDVMDSPVEALAVGAVATGAAIIHDEVEEPASENEMAEDFEELAAMPIIVVEEEIGHEIEDFSMEDTAVSEPNIQDESPELSLEESLDAIESEVSKEFDLVNNFEEIPDGTEDEEASIVWADSDEEDESEKLEEQTFNYDEDVESSEQDFTGPAVGAGAAAVAFAALGGDEEELDKDTPSAEEELPDKVYKDVPAEESETEIIGGIQLETEPLVEEVEEVPEPLEPEWPEDKSVWKGEYFNNTKLDGEPVLVREDAEIDFDWEYGSPFPDINVDNFSVRWTRKADLPPGLYRFTVISDDGARLWVNERLVISAWYDHSPMTFRREMELPGGPVTLRLEYYEKDMTALVHCSWERIG